MPFIYPFLNLLQPGILWPDLADLRPMLVVTFIAMLVGLTRKREGPAGLQNPVFIWLLVFAMVQALSVFRSGFAVVAVEASFWSVYVTFVAASLLLIRSSEDLRRYMWGMVMGGIFIVGYGIYGVFAWGGYSWYGEATGRAGAYGMYENHNDYSFIIVQIVPSIYFLRKSETGFWKRLVLLVCLLTCVIGMFMSLSRGGILALLLELFLIICWNTKGVARAVLIPLILVFGTAATIYQYSARAENQAGGYSAEDSESSRFELWRTARKMFEDRPFLGVGSRRFSEYAKLYDPQMSHNQRGKNSHNTYLEILTGSGLMGFIPFVLMIGVMLRQLRQKFATPGPPLLESARLAIMISLIAILFRATLDAKEIDWSFYMLCAMGVSWFALRSQLESPPRKGASLGRRGNAQVALPV